MQCSCGFAIMGLHRSDDGSERIRNVLGKGFAVQCVKQQVQPLLDVVHHPFLLRRRRLPQMVQVLADDLVYRS